MLDFARMVLAPFARPRLALGAMVLVVLIAQATPLAPSSGLFASADANDNTLSTATLEAPDSTIVVNEQQTSLELHWNPSGSDFVDGYQVYRSSSPGGPYAPVGGTLGAATLSLSDGGLTPGMTYYYVVRALGSGWESEDSPEASGTTLP